MEGKTIPCAHSALEPRADAPAPVDPHTHGGLLRGVGPASPAPACVCVSDVTAAVSQSGGINNAASRSNPKRMASVRDTTIAGP